MDSNNIKQISKSPHLQYRHDINGMRGVAILILFISHGWWNNLPSGKIGVDIFFVISGYLISGIIFRERAKGVYTIWKFYARRIRRLVPALVFFLGYMIYLFPNTYFHTNRARMRQEGSHIMASIMMAENLEHIRMDFNSQYISTVTTHLQSLGLQQQFYIFWPLITGLIMKLNVKWGSLVIIGLICLSLRLQFYLETAYIGWRTCRQIPFARCWQFLVGCLIAYVQFKMKQAEINEQDHRQHQIVQHVDIVSEPRQYLDISQATQTQTKRSANIEKSMGSERYMVSNQITNHKKSIKKPHKNGEQIIVEDFASLEYFFKLLKQLTPFACMYVIYTSAKARSQLLSINNRQVEHAGFTYLKPVLATAVLIITKNTFFNRRILGSKILQLCGDVSYPFYLWHSGLEMAYNSYSDVLIQIYVPALVYACISMEIIEPFFRRNEQKWVIPFLILAQCIIFWKGYEIYSANL